MANRLLVTFLLAAFFVFAEGPVSASEAGYSQQQSGMQKQEQIYGSQLMTKQERIEHRARMRAAKSAEEREQIRKDHHERMKVRARERGVTLPDEPPARGNGRGLRGGRGF